MGSEYYSDDGSESGTDGAMAERSVKNLHILDQLNQEPITIIMNNIGGDTYHMFAIYDAIKACRSHVTVIVMGYAMSAGSLILQAADERIMSPSSRQMIHYGNWAVADHAKTAQKWAKECERGDRWSERCYLERIREKHPTFSLKKLQKLLNFDTFLSAEESVSLGLADKILGQDE